LIQAGQKLSKHIRRETKENELEEKIRHIEQFCPILVDGLCRLSKAPDARRKKAEEGLVKILGRDAHNTKKELEQAHAVLEAHKKKSKIATEDSEQAEDEEVSKEEVEVS
jgi:DNA topoisomerase-6 subunit B